MEGGQESRLEREGKEGEGVDVAKEMNVAARSRFHGKGSVISSVEFSALKWRGGQQGDPRVISSA